MARSVSYPSGAHVAFAHFDIEDEFDWTYIVEDYVDVLLRDYPSVGTDSGWIGREDRVVASNRHARFGISEYCGLVAYWVLPEEDSNIASHWVDQIADRFTNAFSSLRKVGTFSNGEAVFEKVGQ